MFTMLAFVIVYFRSISVDPVFAVASSVSCSLKSLCCRFGMLVSRCAGQTDRALVMAKCFTADVANQRVCAFLDIRGMSKKRPAVCGHGPRNPRSMLVWVHVLRCIMLALVMVFCSGFHNGNSAGSSSSSLGHNGVLV